MCVKMSQISASPSKDWQIKGAGRLGSGSGQTMKVLNNIPELRSGSSWFLLKLLLAGWLFAFPLYVVLVICKLIGPILHSVDFAPGFACFLS